jgi:hypothetical protein
MKCAFDGASARQGLGIPTEMRVSGAFKHPRRRCCRRNVWGNTVFQLYLSVLALTGFSGKAEASAIEGVKLSRPFFNPNVGQTVRIDFRLRRDGLLTVQLLDRDGFIVRHLARAAVAKNGPASFTWDGRDDHETVVPDEAYSLKIDLVVGRDHETYFPGNAPGEEVKVTANYYDRRSGVLSYRLDRPTRVHIQAGLAGMNAKTGKREGPVLKTIANREPRPAGAVVENWNGFDESGSFHVPSLPNFAVAVAATALPENAILTTGNRKEQFLVRAKRRTGRSLFTFSVEDHHHHQGLSTLDDVAPKLRVRPLNAVWSRSERKWTTKAKALKVVADLEGPSAESFARQPGELVVFVNQRRVNEILRPSRGSHFEVELPRSHGEAEIISFNWVSAYGPVAVNNLRISRSLGVSAANLRGEPSDESH